MVMVVTAAGVVMDCVDKGRFCAEKKCGLESNDETIGELMMIKVMEKERVVRRLFDSK